MKDLIINIKSLKIKSPKVVLVVSVIGLLFLLTGTSFALFNSTTTNDKKQIVQTGKVKLELTEPVEGLTFDSIDEMSDTEGLLQDTYYDFSIKNIGDAPVSYKLYLLDDADKIADFKGNLLDDKYIRLGLERNNKEIGPMSLYEVNRLIDETQLDINKTNEYRLRLWLDFSNATEQELDAMTDNYSKFLKIKVVAEQIFEIDKTLSELIMAQGVVTEGNGLYMSTATNDGRPTYYYSGDVTNNYVSFAGHTWRVVRINEDGTIKIIMDEGINNNATYQFNPNNADYKYMYYSESNIEGGAMKNINDWYTSALEANYDEFIATTNFCEAAKVKKSDGYTSGSSNMEVVANYTPSFECLLDGNEKQYVNSKVGLITVDELLLAGISVSSSSNLNVYLQNLGWTMSPAGVYLDIVRAWYLDSGGYVDPIGVSASIFKLHPVISLNANVMATGLGTSGNMWVVQ